MNARRTTSLTLSILFLFGFMIGSASPVRGEPPSAEWIAFHDGPASESDRASDLAVDDEGNVYVTGTTTGDDPLGDILIIKYDRSGRELWAARYDGPARDADGGRALAVDRSGNVLVCGFSRGVGTWNDFVTLKYDPSGNVLWTARYDGPVDESEDAPRAIGLDDGGNLYVTGHSEGDGTGYDYVTIKYAPSGHTLWVARYDGPAGDDDMAAASALDPAGGLFVTGKSWCPESASFDYATVKYDTHGNEVWAARYNGPGDGDDKAHALAVDARGEVVVTGMSWGDGTSYDYGTIKYDSHGNALWTARFNGPADSIDSASALTADALGHVYVTGYSRVSGSNDDFATVKYDDEGTELWVAFYDGPVRGRDIPAEMALDTAGNIHVTGTSRGGVSDDDCATVKYDPDGSELWAVRYDGPAGSSDTAYAIALDDRDDVHIAGEAVRSGSGLDALTIKYTRCPDEDGDGFRDAACGGSDCDDLDPEVHPDHLEVLANGVDDDCDGLIDEPCFIGMLVQ